MVVHADRMRANLELTYGALFSQRVLLALVAARPARATTPTGSCRRLAQQAWDTRHAAARAARARRAAALDLDAIFDLAHYTRHAAEIVGRLDAIAA